MSTVPELFVCRRCGDEWVGERKRGQKPYYCTPCRPLAIRERDTENARKYRAKHRDRLRAKARAAYAADPERYRGYGIKVRYGISLAEYNALFELQGKQCALCPATECQTGRAMPVDHDHETGAVRGILCHSCNSTLLPGYEALPPELRDSPRLNAYLASAVERGSLVN